MNIRNLAEFEITSVKPAKDGGKWLGTVRFAYRPSEFEPVKVIQRAKTPRDQTKYVNAEIDGARIVRIHTAFLHSGKNGDPYVV